MIHKSSFVHKSVKIPKSTNIWHFCHIMKNAKIGNNCNIGQNVFIGENVIIGNNVKIQNNVSLYSGVEIEDDVFLGPSCVFTNVINPRSNISRKKEFKKTLVKKNVTIGANATIVCGLTLDQYSFIGAGSVITKNTKKNSLVYGNPAKHNGWVTNDGLILDKKFFCREKKIQFKMINKKLIKIDE